MLMPVLLFFLILSMIDLITMSSTMYSSWSKEGICNPLKNALSGIKTRTGEKKEMGRRKVRNRGVYRGEGWGKAAKKVEWGGGKGRGKRMSRLRHWVHPWDVVDVSAALGGRDTVDERHLLEPANKSLIRISVVDPDPVDPELFSLLDPDVMQEATNAWESHKSSKLYIYIFFTVDIFSLLFILSFWNEKLLFFISTNYKFTLQYTTLITKLSQLSHIFTIISKKIKIHTL